MTDPLKHESYLAFESAIQEAQQKALVSCDSLAKQLQKVHDTVRDLSLLVDTEQTNREEQWRLSGERLDQFRKALAGGLGIADEEKARIAYLTAALAERDEALTQAQEHMAALEKEHGELVASSGAARERVAALENREQQAQERVTTLESELAGLKAEQAALQADLEAARALSSEGQEAAGKLGALEQETSTLREELAAAQAAADERAARIQSLNADLTQARTTSDERDKAIEALTNVLSQTRNNGDEKDKTLQTLTDDLRQARETLEDQEKTLKALREDLDRACDEKEAHAKTVQTLTEDLAKARSADEEQNRAIQALTSDLATAHAEAAEWLASAQREPAPPAEPVKETAPEIPQNTADEPVLELDLEVDSPEKVEAAIEATPAPSEPPTISVPEVKEPPARVESAPERTRLSRRPMIGQLLLDAQVITETQLDDAMATQADNSNRHLGDILIEKGYADEKSIAQVLAAQSQTEFCRLVDRQIDSAAVALVNERLAQQHTCIAIRATGGVLLLAIANPMNLLAIEDVERATGRKVELVVATPSDIKEAIAKFYWEPE